MSSTGCPGFRAHSINPTRCRRCFKDASEHGDAGKDGGSEAENSTTPRTRRTPSFTGDITSARKDSLGSGGGGGAALPASASFGGGLRTTRSPSFKADALPTLTESTNMSSPSATFTVKQKRVKFVDADSDNGGGSGSADNNNNNNNTRDRSSKAAYDVELKNRETEPVNVEFTISMKKPRASLSEGSSRGGGGTSEDYQSRIKELSQELSKAKEKIDVLEAKNKEIESMRKSFSKSEGGRESIKANFDENAKLKQKIDDLEATVRTLKSDKLRLQSKTTQSDSAQVLELRAKLEKSEKLVNQLTAENEDIKKDVKSLEVEFQELHDNFREDHTSEFRVVKRELEAMSKNCRVMQFKLKKAERTIEQLENEKIDLQKNVSELYETAKMDVDKRRMKELENELAIAKEVSLKLHAEIETLKEERMIAVEQMQELQRQQSNSSSQGGHQQRGNSSGPQRLSSTPKLSPTPSFDQTTKDYEQVVRDLYDCMEREKDLQEQLKFAEEETKTTRKKLSTMEQENEILMMQIRKMASTKNAKVGEDDDSDELNPEELKLHLELYEQEMVVLRRKCDELEQENDNFTQEIKYLQEKLVSQPLARVEIPEIPAGSPPNVIYDHKIRLLEAETRELRKKLVDKEKENESLRTEVELHRRRASKVITRSRSLDNEGQSLDMKKQLALFEQEAAILRQKLITLENDNEKLVNENKRLQLRISKKPPPGPADQLQLENMELKERIRDYERKCDSLKTDLMNAKLNETTDTETDFIANLKKQLRAKETDLATLSTKAAEADVECARLNREYKKLKDSLVPRRRVSRVIRETATRMELKEIIKEMEDEVAELQTINRGRDSVIENLTEEISELKREYQELENRVKNGSAGAGGGSGESGSKIEELRAKLQDEQHRVKSLEARLEALGREKNVDVSLMDSLEVLQSEKKEMAIRLEDLTSELEKARKRTKDLSGKLDVHTRNKDDLAVVNVKLRDSLEKVEDELEELSRRLKASEAGGAELKKKCEEMRRELERVANLNVQLKKESDEQKSKLAAINSRSGGVSEQSALLQKEAADLKRKLEESRRSVETLQRAVDSAKAELKEREAKWKEELKEQLEITSKKVRREVHLELQTLREESTNYRNRCQELVGKLDHAEKEVKEAAERLKANAVSMRKEREELTDRIHSLESAAKAEQRKREKLEREVESATRGKEEELLQAQDRLVQMERDARRLTAKLEDVEYEYQGKVNAAEREAAKLKADYEELTGKYDLLEKDFVALKSRAVAEKETLLETVSSLKRSYEDKLAEIKALKESSMSHQKEWFKEKLHYQERIASFEAKANKAKLVEEERDRLKVLVADKENLLNSYRKEERSHNEERERNRIRTDELTGRLAELERVERNTRFLSITGRAQVDKELADYRIRLEHSETSHKGELAALHAEYEGRMRLLGDEVDHMQRQIASLALERDQLRDSLEKTTREMHNRGTMRGTLKDEVEDLGAQLRTLRSDLEGALLENRNLKIQHGTERSSWAIQAAEYKTQINQLEERILLETRGTTRNYARTKMELAWEKERTENHRLLQETQRFIQELRDKLVGTESLREKEREEARKQLLELKAGMDREHGGTQAKIAELHFDLLALKEAHVRLKSQNERLRRERATLEKSKVDFVGEELAALQKVLDSKALKSATGKEVAAEVVTLQKKLSTRLEELISEAAARGVSSSDLSIASRAQGRGGTSGSLTSINSTTLPPPSAVKRAPPRTKSLGKKSLSLDQQLGRASIERQIWGGAAGDSDANTSLNTTPNSSVSNLRFGGGPVRYGYAGYDSDSSGSSFFGPAGQLRLKSGVFAKEGSFAGGSESDTSAASGVPGGAGKSSAKSSLKEKFKIRRSSKTSDPGTTGGAATDTEDKQTKLLKQKLTLAGFEMSPLEMAKQREKKEKSLRYKISKTLSKTFSRSTSMLDGEGGNNAAERSKSPKRTKSPSRTKSPTRREEGEKSSKPEPPTTTATFSSSTLRSTTTSRTYSSNNSTSMIGSVTPRSYEPISTYKSSLTVSGLAQLRQPPTVSKSNLAVPPSVRPKVRLRTETNV